MWTPEKEFKLTRSGLGHRIWRVKDDRKKLHMKQRVSKEEKIFWKERISNEEIDRKKIKDIHLRIGHASKENMKTYLEDSGITTYELKI